MKMVEVKTAELVGPALDWAVAKAAHGVELELFDTCCGSGNWNGNPNEPPECCGQPVKTMHLVPSPEWRPSVDWAQCGPLIDKFKVLVCPPCGEDHWDASNEGDSDMHYAPDVRTSICRAVVSAVSGPVVGVPTELINGCGL